MGEFSRGSIEQMLDAFEQRYAELSEVTASTSISAAEEPIDIWSGEFDKYCQYLQDSLKKAVQNALGAEHVEDVYVEADEENLYVHLDVEIPFPLAQTRYNYDEDDVDVSLLKQAVKDAFNKLK